MILTLLMWVISALAVIAAIAAAFSRSERAVLFASGVASLCVAWFLFVGGYEYLALLTTMVTLFVVLVGYLYVVVESDMEISPKPWFVKGAPAVLIVIGVGLFLSFGISRVFLQPGTEGKQTQILGTLFVRDSRLSLYVMALALLVGIVGGAAMSRKEQSS